MYVHSFKELNVWIRATDLVKEIYQMTSQLPREEMYGLLSQMRRASVSIPSNIAEGKKRRTRKDFLHFLRIADGSAAELETQLHLVEMLYPYLKIVRSCELLKEVQKMLAVFIHKLLSQKSNLF